MGHLLYDASEFKALSNSLHRVAPEVEKELKKELKGVAREVAMRTREKVPSGMRAARYGVSWGAWGSKGAYMKIGGKSSPKSWVGALEGSRAKKGFRHPVYPVAGSDRTTWNWGPKGGYQPNQPILHETWLEMQTWAVLKAEEAIQRAVDRALERGS